MTYVFLQTLISGVLVGGIYCLVGSGLTVIFGVMRIINACHGDLIMIAMYLSYYLHRSTGLEPLASVFITGPCLFLLGAVMQRFLVSRLRGSYAEDNSLLLTFGIGLILANAVLLLFTADFRVVETAYSRMVWRIADLSISVSYLFSSRWHCWRLGCSIFSSCAPTSVWLFGQQHKIVPLLPWSGSTSNACRGSASDWAQQWQVLPAHSHADFLFVSDRG